MRVYARVCVRVRVRVRVREGASRSGSGAVDIRHESFGAGSARSICRPESRPKRPSRKTALKRLQSAFLFQTIHLSSKSFGAILKPLIAL